MTSHTAQFRFYEELNDFLSREWKKVRFSYRFKGTPSVKDTIEAMGVPHTEIDLILVNGQSVDFHYLLGNHDDVAVYPMFEGLDITPILRLRPKPLRDTVFILDTQLGRLAKTLRMLGFDTLYRNDYTREDIIALSKKERRIILTRDISLLKNKTVTHGFWIRSLNPGEQIREVIQRFDLYNRIRPFQRCLECNGIVSQIEKERIVKKVPPRAVLHFDNFYQCADCEKIYWKGSHYQKMKESISELIRR
jgi:uncharacterized protein with PIN domain